ncbi:MAG TPA: low temperature requirement protein A [Jatrophihabitantaceae bacterium]
MTTTATFADPPIRVSTLELFFDLVFVFTITQVAATSSTPRAAVASPAPR